jgi:glycogen operon protein
MPASHQRDSLLSLIRRDFQIERGSPLPLGATLRRGGINFAIFSRNATSANLVLFAPQTEDPALEFPLDARFHRTGDVWHIFVRGLDPGVEYAWRMDRRPNDAPQLHRFDPQALLLDPYAHDVTGGEIWGEGPRCTPHRRNQRRCLLVSGDFDWQFDAPLNIPLADTILYELHVRGFTRHNSSDVKQPGTFAALAEKIPYLTSLGVNAVELLPVFEFEEADHAFADPATRRPLLNFWGYNPISFFAPKASYAAARERSAEIREFKEMVRAFHAAGIEVILDVVFNHTAEGDVRGPTLSFRGIDNETFYIVDPVTGAYHNYTGCGNTLNCNHPVVRDLVIDALRYWVIEMHVDGFRFDLASILGRGRHGEVLANPPLLERIAADPVLSSTKLIAEAWDAAGLYQVGSFPSWGRWAEWNGKFRDDIRRFLRGEEGFAQAVALRLAGSPDLYRDDPRNPYHSINFVTCHDGFTLADLVSYNAKLNDANGESNADGTNDNFSWNCGTEGASSDQEILRLRRRQQRNFATLLLLAQGVPMLLAGDEFGRTQRGNNNAYCQDNDISWLDWRLAEDNRELLRFFQRLIAFRKANSLVRTPRYFEWKDSTAALSPAAPPSAISPFLTPHGVKLFQPDWRPCSHSFALHFFDPKVERGCMNLYLAANAYWEPLPFQLPSPYSPLPQSSSPIPRSVSWLRFVDTSLASPNDIADPGKETVVPAASAYSVGPRSIVVLFS